MKLPLTLILSGLLFAVTPVRADEVPSLEFGMGKEAKQILKKLREEGIHNVGVLKFLLTREGDKKFSDALGPMNLLLARRLEVALVVKNSPSSPIGIIQDASAVAAGIPGANHLTPAGLDKLFAAEYPLAWGKEKVKPDAFLVGEGMVERDLRTLHLGIHLIDAKTRKRQTLTPDLVMRIRPEHLTEIGESFSRGVFDGGQAGVEAGKDATLAQMDKVSDIARKVRTKQETHPMSEPNSPFGLEVAYDSQVQPIEVRDGQAWIAEPREGQTVAIRLMRHDPSDRKYAVVLKVNGENVLFREKLPDLQCLGWIIEQRDVNAPREIKGFQISDDRLEAFRVASRQESRAREINYGSDVGTISMTVFGEAKGSAAPRVLNYEQRDEQLIRRTELPKPAEKPSTFSQLQQDLYKGLVDSRGLIVEGGPTQASAINRVKFQRDPVPVMSVTLHYYKKSP